MSNKHFFAFLLALFVVFPFDLCAQNKLAFPGAEGYGRYATGGRGGKTYVVTSLEDCPENKLVEGTFRWAVKQPGKKIVTFAVNGTIFLTSPLCLDSGDLTILGQSAPGEGICLADYPVTISCENAIIRYLRIRLGNRQVAYHEGDGFGLEECNNVIVDHCSFSWSIDECLSVSDASNVTISWCMIEQALCNAGHQKGSHGYGGNWGGHNVSYHHNLIVHCSSRVPRLGGDGFLATRDFVDIRNNVFYNWGGQGCYGAEATEANLVNNYYKPGPHTDTRGLTYRKRIIALGLRSKSYVKSYPAFAEVVDVWGDYYINGNVNADYDDVTADNWTNGVYNQTSNGSDLDYTWTAATRDSIRLRSPREFMQVTTHSAEEAYEMVLLYAGASYHRDCLDEIMVYDTETRSATASGSNGSTDGIIDRQSDNGFSAAVAQYKAWPILKAIAPENADSDGDGVPDKYENAWQLDSSDPADGAKIFNTTNANYNGYSYTEVCQNSLNKSLQAWNAYATEGGERLGVETPTIEYLRRAPWEHEISVLTFKGYDSSAKKQLYADDLKMDATGGISGATGRRQTLKLRAQQYTIHVPSSIRATALRICGYSNYTGTDIHISECNGKSYGATDYVISATADTWSDITVPLETPVTGGKVTLTFKGNSPTVKIYVVEDHDTALDDVRSEPTPSQDYYYDLNGRPISEVTTGFYIHNGKKILVR